MTQPPIAANPVAPEKNALVETGGDKSKSAFEGAGIVQDFADAWIKCSGGDWAEGLANAGIGAFGLAEAIADPLAALSSAGIGWLIEHVWFLKEPLDWVAGDQDELTNMTETWGNIGKHLEGAATDLGKFVDTDAAHWQGEGAEAYKAFAKERADTYAGIASGAQSVSTLIDISKMILNVVRSVIRDLISECVGKLIGIASRYPGPAIVAGTIAEGVPMAVKWAKKILDKVVQLTKAFKNGSGLFKRLGEIFQKAKKLLDSDLFKKIGDGARTIASESKPVVDGVKDAMKGGMDNFAAKVAKEKSELPGTFGEAGRELGEKLTTGFPKELAGEGKKEISKKTGEQMDDDAEDAQKEREAAQASPVFEQPGSGRISGTI